MTQELKITVEGSTETVSKTLRALAAIFSKDFACDAVRFTGAINPGGFSPVEPDFLKGALVTFVGQHTPTTAFFSAMRKLTQREAGEDVVLTDEESRELLREFGA